MKTKWQKSYLWLLLYAAALVLSSGRLSFAAAAWLVPFLALRFIHTDPGTLKKRMVRVFLVSWIALSATWYGATPLWGLPHFMFMGVNAGFTVLPYLVYEKLRHRLNRTFAATLVYPATFVSIEWLTVFGSPFGSFGAGAYSQYGFLPFLQLLSVTGLLGVSFLIAWTGAVAAWAVESIKAGRSWILPAAGAFLIVALVFTWGSFRLHAGTDPRDNDPGAADSPGAPRAPGAPVSVVGLTAAAVSMQELMPLLNNDQPEFRRRTGEIHRRYLEESKQAAGGGPDLIVWPEAAGVGTFADVARLTRDASEIAARHELYMVVPTMSLDPSGERTAVNKAVLLGPDGSVVTEHVKFGGNFMEGTVPGDKGVTVADTELGRLGLVICWDADFPAVVAEVGRRDVEILVVTALDWEGIDPLHGEMALFRAIENGTTLVRQADTGWSGVADPYGRVIAEADGPCDRVEAQIRPAAVGTLYTRLGNALGPVCAAAVVVVIAILLLFGRVGGAARASHPKASMNRP